MEMRKIGRRRPCSVDGAEFGHFTSSFCRGRQRNNVRAPLLCYWLNLLFGAVFVAVVVVVCFSSLLPPWLQRLTVNVIVTVRLGLRHCMAIDGYWCYRIALMQCNARSMYNLSVVYQGSCYVRCRTLPAQCQHWQGWQWYWWQLLT